MLGAHTGLGAGTNRHEDEETEMSTTDRKTNETDDTEGSGFRLHVSPDGTTPETDDTEGNSSKFHVSPEGETDDTEGSGSRHPAPALEGALVREAFLGC